MERLGGRPWTFTANVVITSHRLAIAWAFKQSRSSDHGDSRKGEHDSGISEVTS